MTMPTTGAAVYAVPASNFQVQPGQGTQVMQPVPGQGPEKAPVLNRGPEEPPIANQTEPAIITMS